MMRVAISTLSFLLLLGWTGLDDQPLPSEATAHISFQSFEIDPSRNYFIARLVNNSPYLLSSCRINLSIYQESSLPPNELILSEWSPFGDLPSSGPIVSENFLIRDPLRPGYSNEVYYELKMDHLRGTAVYVKGLSDLKGRLLVDQKN